MTNKPALPQSQVRSVVKEIRYKWYQLDNTLIRLHIDYTYECEFLMLKGSNVQQWLQQWWTRSMKCRNNLDHVRWKSDQKNIFCCFNLEFSPIIIQFISFFYNF